MARDHVPRDVGGRRRYAHDIAPDEQAALLDAQLGHGHPLVVVRIILRVDELERLHARGKGHGHGHRRGQYLTPGRGWATIVGLIGQGHCGAVNGSRASRRRAKGISTRAVLSLLTANGNAAALRFCQRSERREGTKREESFGGWKRASSPGAQRNNFMA